VYVALSMSEPPLLRLPYPSVAEAEAAIAACEDASEPREPYQLISQYTLEPLLQRALARWPSVSVCYGHECLSIAQEDHQITAHVRAQDGSDSELTAAWLAGCDGGASLVRKQLGIPLRGEGDLLRLTQALYHCPDLYDRLPIANGPGRGRHYHMADA